MKTLYLGPKVDLSLSFVPFYLRKLVTILVATIISLSAFSQELVFKYPGFNAALQDKQVVLNWVTTGEKNVSHFVIEKSGNGIEYK